jgi:hypothetical protein
LNEFTLSPSYKKREERRSIVVKFIGLKLSPINLATAKDFLATKRRKEYYGKIFTQRGKVL